MTVSEIRVGDHVRVWKEGSLVFGGIYPISKVEDYVSDPVSRWDLGNSEPEEGLVRIVTGESFYSRSMILLADRSVELSSEKNSDGTRTFEVSL